MKQNFRISQIIISIMLVITILSGCRFGDIQSVNENIEAHLVTGEWKFRGYMGSYIDKIAEHRILDKENWDIIYPETEEPFRLREDDVDYPQRGVWAGEFWGKYMLSVIAAAHYYNSDDLRLRIAEAVKGVSKLQDENGYIGSYKHSDFVKGDNWNVWGRKYTLWALVEAWELLGDESILKIATSFTDHLISEVGPDAINIVETGNFYGMPSTSILQPIVKLYNATNDKKYLDYAEYIVQQWAQHPDDLPDILNKGLSGLPVHHWFNDSDPFNWAKGYEFTSCVEGLLELYQVTNKTDYFTAAENIHSAMVESERTPIGSISFNDKFVGSVGIINTASEVCDAVYWNRLSYKLYEITGDAKYIDEIERTLYNSLMASANIDGTWALRRIRMSHVHVVAHNHFLDHHQCCTDNLPRGFFQASEVVVMNRNNDIFLSLFNEGEGKVQLTSGQTTGLKMDGDFLNGESVSVVLSIEKPEKFKLKIRQPKWSDQLDISVNGERFIAESSESWISIEREWSNNDVIKIHFDLNVWWETFHPEKSKDLFSDMKFYDAKWAQMKFKKGTNEQMNKKYESKENLTISDALPNKPAVAFFYGPVALARDVRITEGDIFEKIQFKPSESLVSIKPVQAPDGIWKAFELKLGEGQIFKFCDFSSAGDTWNYDSKFNTWCLLD